MNRKPWFTEGWNEMTYEEQEALASQYEAQREDAGLDDRERARERA